MRRDAISLDYQGELKSAGNNNNRLKEKKAIRRALSTQLEELWTKHKSLQGNIGVSGDESYTAEGYLKRQSPEEELAWTARQAAKLREPISIGHRTFLPLIRKSQDTACSIDILFLRKDSPGSVIYAAGDLDNRLKLLFDGLRMPEAAEISPDDTDELVYCLTEDDALISDFSVKTDYLLSRPDASPSEVILIMDINVGVTRFTEANAHLHF